MSLLRTIGICSFHLSSELTQIYYNNFLLSGRLQNDATYVISGDVDFHSFPFLLSAGGWRFINLITDLLKWLPFSLVNFTPTSGSLCRFLPTPLQLVHHSI